MVLDLNEQQKDVVRDALLAYLNEWSGCKHTEIEENVKVAEQLLLNL